MTPIGGRTKPAGSDGLVGRLRGSLHPDRLGGASRRHHPAYRRGPDVSTLDAADVALRVRAFDRRDVSGSHAAWRAGAGAAQPHDAGVYHYRDNTGLEVDAIVETAGGAWMGVEIKLGGERPNEEGARNLLKLRDRVDPDRTGPPAHRPTGRARGNCRCRPRLHPAGRGIAGATHRARPLTLLYRGRTAAAGVRRAPIAEWHPCAESCDINTGQHHAQSCEHDVPGRRLRRRGDHSAGS